MPNEQLPNAESPANEKHASKFRSLLTQCLKGGLGYRHPLIQWYRSLHASATMGRAKRWWLTSVSCTLPSTVRRSSAPSGFVQREQTATCACFCIRQSSATSRRYTVPFGDLDRLVVVVQNPVSSERSPFDRRAAAVTCAAAHVLRRPSVLRRRDRRGHGRYGGPVQGWS